VLVSLPPLARVEALYLCSVPSAFEGANFPSTRHVVRQSRLVIQTCSLPNDFARR
jgi:hypothetical protein